VVSDAIAMDEPSRERKRTRRCSFALIRVASFFGGNVAARDPLSAGLVRYPTNVVLERSVP